MQTYGEYLITQKTFRALLQAMSHPGRVYNIGDFISDSPIRPFTHSPLMLVLQTLLDHEVGFRVIGTGKEYLETTISELTRCPVKDISDADFIIVSDGESNGEILKAKRGSLEYPDTGATVIYVVEFLNDRDNGKPIALLKGPGIRNDIAPVIHGLGQNELFHIKENNSEFPLGIDCIFIDGANRIMCIPRSTRIEVR
ncbi:phosphonate C-P lyase system protein PhnH [Dissulfurispira sp.]|uniref:phosphonate C-P lyase system protein PhnH n=1 Tax=Dissulfurispira sp. TaxID=2817609 RepID=UPI002FD8C6F1